MIRFTSRNRLRLAAALAVVMLTAAIDNRVRALDAMSASPPRGLSHRIYVSVRFDPASPHRRQAAARATLTALVRISDHAREASFFGVVLATFADFAVAEAPPERLVWQDAGCHQDRGAPKVAVVSLNGVVTSPQGEAAIAARPRRLGQRLPADELVPGQAFVLGSDRIGRFAVRQAATRQSRIEVEVKISTVVCDMRPGEQGK
jgi:hypothetical protein